MAQVIWKGHISFGLVSIPVALYSGEQRNELRFHLLDKRNKARVRYQRVNEETGKEVVWDAIVKGFEYEKGNYVLLDDEDFSNAAPEVTKSIDIENFVNLADIEHRYFDKPYFLVPTDNPKGYVLLRDTIADSGKGGIAKVVIRSRQHLAALVADGNALVLNLLRFQDELRSADEFKFPTAAPKTYHISKKEQDMARQLIESMSADWDPAAYRDDYREALLDYIERKAKQGKTAAERGAKPAKKETAKIIDFTERLRQSVERSQGEKGPARRKKSSGKKKARTRSKKRSATKRSGRKAG